MQNKFANEENLADVKIAEWSKIHRKKEEELEK